MTTFHQLRQCLPGTGPNLIVRRKSWTGSQKALMKFAKGTVSRLRGMVAGYAQPTEIIEQRDGRVLRDQFQSARSHMSDQARPAPVRGYPAVPKPGITKARQRHADISS